MSQIIIIESVEALAIQIERELIKHSCDAPVVDSIISCLHPIEVPSEAEELVDKIRKGSARVYMEMGIYSPELSTEEAAALIESYGRRVPRAMLEELWEYCTTDHDFSPGELSESEIVDMSKIAAKYGVKVEG